MKKAGIFAAVIAVVLIFLQLYSYKLEAYLPEAAYTVPSSSYGAALVGKDKEELTASWNLNRYEESSPVYARGGNLYFGEDKDKIELSYPLYVNEGSAVLCMSDRISLISTEFQILPSYQWLYVSGGTSFNSDRQQADAEEFILLGLPDHLYLNSSQAVLTGRSGNLISTIRENSLVNFAQDKISWYEYQDGVMVYRECTQLFDMDITIGSLTCSYVDFLDRLGLMEEMREEKGGQLEETTVEVTELQTAEEPEGQAGGLAEEQSKALEDKKRKETEESSPSLSDQEGGAGSRVPETSPAETIAKDANGETSPAYGETDPFVPTKGPYGNGDSGRDDGGSGSGELTPSISVPGTGAPGDETGEGGEGTGKPGEGGDEGSGGGSGEGGDYFEMPVVTVTDFTTGVYDITTEITIEDPGERIYKGVRFLIYRDGRLYMRKLVKESGVVKMEPLPPDTYFEVEGYFEYFNQYNGKSEYYFLKKQKLQEPTKGIDQLEKVDVQFKTSEGVRYPDQFEVLDMNFKKTATPSSATPSEPETGGDGMSTTVRYIQNLYLKVKKAGIDAWGTRTFTVDSTALAAMKRGESASYKTPVVLDSDASYEYELQVCDRFGNQLYTRPGDLNGMAITSKRQPKAQVIFEKGGTVGAQPVSIIMSNKDKVKFYKNTAEAGSVNTEYASFYMVSANDMANPLTLVVDGKETKYVDVGIADGKTTSFTIEELPAGQVYYGMVMGNFELEDKKVHRDEEIGRNVFTTSNISTLGSVNFNVRASTITSSSAVVQAYVRSEINRKLIPFLSRVTLTLADQNSGAVYRTVELKKEDLERYTMEDKTYVVEDTTGSGGFGARVEISLPDGTADKTAWDALLSSGMVILNFTDGELNSNTQYTVSVRTYASQNMEGSKEEEVTGRYFTGSFRTTKKTPVITYHNMLVTNNFARFYGLNIDDPDGVVKNGSVSVILTMTDNGRVVSVEPTTIEKINAGESFHLEGLSSDIRYDLKIYGVEYNEGFTSSTAKVNQRLQSVPENMEFVTGSTINGSVDISAMLNTYGEDTGIVGSNLFDPNDAKVGTSLTSVGLEVASTNPRVMTSDYIPVNPDKTYLRTGTNSVSTIYYYDADKKCLGNTTSGISYWRLDQPIANTAYVRFTLEAVELNKVSYCQMDESLFRGDHSSNGFDKNKADEGSRLKTDGETEISAANFVSDFIPVEGSREYVRMNMGLKGTTVNIYNRRVAYYDENHKFLSYVDLNFWYYSFVTPKDARYVKLGGDMGYIDDTYFAKVNPTLVGEELFRRDGVISGYALSAFGGMTVSPSNSVSEYIEVEPGATYRNVNSIGGVCYYDENKSFLGYVSTYTSSILVPSKAAYLRFNYQNTYLDNVRFYKIMPSAGDNDITARISVNLSDKESYLKDHPQYKIGIEKKNDEGEFEPDGEILRNVTVVDGKVQPVAGYEEFATDRSSSYRVTLMVDLFDQTDVVLSQAEFKTSERSARNYIVRSEAGLASMMSDPFGDYVAVKDIVNYSSIFTDLKFHGTLDFQGHALTRRDQSAVFTEIGERGTVKNMVYHYSTSRNKTGFSSVAFLVQTNRGTMQNIVADFDVNLHGVTGYNGGLCYFNQISGVIENFSITLLDDFVAGGRSGLVACQNYGMIRNGYVYDGGKGYRMENTRDNTAGGDYRGSIAGLNEHPGIVQNVYSLVDANYTIEGGNYVTVGTVVGGGAGFVYNAFTTADALGNQAPQPVSGPVVGGTPTAGRYGNLQYVRLKEHVGPSYVNTYQREAKKESLADPNWYQDVINQDGQFQVDMPYSGYYPRVLMPFNLMNVQPLIPLPESVKPTEPVLTSAMVKEQREADADVLFTFKNPQSVPVRDVTVSTKDVNGSFTKAMDCTITNQYQNEEGNYMVEATLHHPVSYYSLYYVEGFTIQIGSGSTDIRPVLDQMKTIDVEFYQEIRDIEGWKGIKDNPKANYRVCADLDFGRVTDAQMINDYTITGIFSGKIDGGFTDQGGYRIVSLKNLNLPKGYMFQNFSGTLSNLHVEGMTINDPRVVGNIGFIGNANGALIDHVQIRDSKVISGTTGGMVVGSATGTTIRNCSVINSELEGSRYRQLSLGGIAGIIQNSFIQNSFVQEFTLTARNALGVDGTGGICGNMSSYSRITNCSSQGTLVTNYNNAGGIVGTATPQYLTSGCISNMDMVTNGSGYTGGIAGYFSAEGLRGNLAVGDIYSSNQDPMFFQRIVGYYNGTISGASNLAYESQVFKDAPHPELLDDADGLVSQEDLKKIETYRDRMKFSSADYEFAFEENGTSKGIADGYLPLLRSNTTGEVLENQTPQRIALTGIQVGVEMLTKNNAPDNDFRELFGNDAQHDFGSGDLFKLHFNVDSQDGKEYQIVDVKIEGFELNTNHSYGGVIMSTFKESKGSTVEGKNRITRTYPFLQTVYAFDRYRIEVTATEPDNLDGEGHVVDETKLVKASTSFDMSAKDRVTFKIGNAKEWNEIMSQNGGVYANFEIIGDIDETTLPDGEKLVTGVKANRIYSTKPEGLTISGVSMDASKGETALIQEVTSGISRLNFKDITIEGSNVGTADRYLGVIGLMWGKMEYVNFEKIQITSGESYYSGCVGYSGGTISNVNLKDIQVIGKNGGVYIGGLAGYAHSVDRIKSEGSEQDGVFSYRISGGTSVGGVVGYCAKEATRVTIDTVKVTAVNYYAGGIIGRGSVNGTTVIDKPEERSLVQSCVIIGGYQVGGVIGNGTARYTDVKDSFVQGTTDRMGTAGTMPGESAGGIVGFGLAQYCTVERSVIQGYDEVGGIVSTGGGNGYSNFGNQVKDSKIIGRNRVGGIVGRGGVLGGTAADEASHSSVSTSSITGNSYVGGLIGEAWYTNRYASVSDCQIKGNSYVGGALGRGFGGSASTLNYVTVSGSSISAGKMTGDLEAGSSYAGGLVGYVNNASLYNNCFVDETTTVDAAGNYVGGLAGYGGSGRFYNCGSGAQINQSPATGEVGEKIGGLFGGLACYYSANATEIYKTTQVYNCYFSGKVKGFDNVAGLFGSVTKGDTGVGSPAGILAANYYGLVMTGDVETSKKGQVKADYAANSGDGCSVSDIGYLRVYENSLINGETASTKGLPSLGEDENSKPCSITASETESKETYNNPYEFGGLNWSSKDWNWDGMQPLERYLLNINPETDTSVGVTGNIPDGTYQVTLSEGYVKEGLLAEYDGINNTRSGNNPDTRVWENLTGDAAFDLKPVKLNFDLVKKDNGTFSGKDGWTETSYHMESAGNRGWINESLNDRMYGDMTMSISFQNKANANRVLMGFNTWSTGTRRMSLMNAASSSTVQRGGVHTSTSSLMADYSIGERHHVTAVFREADRMVSYYLDGKLSGTAGPYTDWTTETFLYDFTLMSGLGGDYPSVYSDVYNAKLYTRALLPAEVEQNYRMDQIRFRSETGGNFPAYVKKDVKFKNGSAVLDLADTGMTPGAMTDLAVQVETADSEATGSDAKPAIANGILHAYRYGSQVAAYESVVTLEGQTPIEKKDGMYTCTEIPVADAGSNYDEFQWYRSGVPGYGGEAIEGGTSSKAVLQGRGYYYCQVKRGSITGYTPLILVDTPSYMPYVLDNVKAVLKGQEGSLAEARTEELKLPGTYTREDTSPTETEIPEFMKKQYIRNSVQDGWYGGGNKAPIAPIALKQVSMNLLRMAEGLGEMPELRVYPSGVDTVNLEFSAVSPESYATVTSGSDLIAVINPESRVYTMQYDYKSPLRIVVNHRSGLTEPVIYEYDSTELRRTVLTYGEHYYYLKDGTVCGDGEPLEGEFLHLYEGEAISKDGTLYDLETGKLAGTFGTMKLSEETKPLYEAEYDGYQISTYEGFYESSKDGETISNEKKLLVKDEMLYALETVDTIPGSFVTDRYQDQVYLVQLSDEGKLVVAGDSIKTPAGFTEQGIAHTTNNMDSSQPWLLVRYENGTAKGFNYLTGEELAIENAVSDTSLIHYAKNFLSAKWDSMFETTDKAFADLKELEQELTVYPIDESMLFDGEEGSGTDDGMKETEFAVEHDADFADGSGEGGAQEEEGQNTETGDSVLDGSGSSKTDGVSIISSDGNGLDGKAGAGQVNGSEVKPDGDEVHEKKQNDAGVDADADAKAEAGSDAAKTKDGEKTSGTAGTDPVEPSAIEAEAEKTESGADLNHGQKRTKYVYSYNDSKKQYDLYKTEDLLSKEEDRLLSERQKLEQLASQGMVANYQKLEESAERSLTKEAKSGMVIFALTAISALALAGYVVRRKRKL